MNTSELTMNNIKNNLLIGKYIKKIIKNNNHHPNISINVDLIEEPIINSKKSTMQTLLLTTMEHMEHITYKQI